VSGFWLGRVPGSTPVSCGCISNRGKEPIRISSPSSWFSDFGDPLFIRFVGASGSCLGFRISWSYSKPSLTCLHAQFAPYDLC